MGRKISPDIGSTTAKREKHSKYYAQSKMDKITNPGAREIRLRSLPGALEERRREYAG